MTARTAATSIAVLVALGWAAAAGAAEPADGRDWTLFSGKGR